MIFLILLSICGFLGLVVVVICIAHFCYMKSEKEIFFKTYQTTDWSLLSDSTHCGDDLGDNFLKEAGTAQIYQAKSILELASSSGVAGEVFLKQFQTVPSWVDLDLVKKGSEFQKQWIEVYFGAALGSIIESYGYSNGANILIETGRLTCGKDTKRRLLETAIFNYDVIEYGLHSPDSIAFETVARVRLLHCMVRRHMKQSCPWWDIDSMGVPVSQEDGAHTIFLNSHVTIRGMENQGLPITLEQKNSMSMFWAYCGYLLGIDEKFLPRTYQQEILFYETIYDHAFNPSSKSYQLIESSITGSSNLPPYYFTPSQQTALARLSLGTEISNQLHLPPTKDVSSIFLICSVRLLTFAQWSLYSLTGWKYSFVTFLRKCLLTALDQCGKGGPPKWRFVVTRKIS
jgi:hypothetical protein